MILLQSGRYSDAHIVPVSIETAQWFTHFIVCNRDATVIHTFFLVQQVIYSVTLIVSCAIQCLQWHIVSGAISIVHWYFVSGAIEMVQRCTYCIFCNRDFAVLHFIWCNMDSNRLVLHSCSELHSSCLIADLLKDLVRLQFLI